MFLIQEKELPADIKECVECMEDFDVVHMGIAVGMAGYDMCKNCESKVRTTFRCPECHELHSFSDKFEPGYCKKCKIILPNIEDLKTSPTKRVDYHNREVSL